MMTTMTSGDATKVRRGKRPWPAAAASYDDVEIDDSEFGGRR